MHFKDELLELEVGNGCSSIPLKDYQLTDEELEIIEGEIIEQMRIAFDDQDLRLDLNGRLWDWIIQHCDNRPIITVFIKREHEWELSHGRFNSMVRWLNPQRNEVGKERYYNDSMSEKPNCRGIQACTETQVPMNSLEALAWAHECVEDDEFLNFFGVPINLSAEVPIFN